MRVPVCNTLPRLTLCSSGDGSDSPVAGCSFCTGVQWWLHPAATSCYVPSTGTGGWGLVVAVAVGECRPSAWHFFALCYVQHCWPGKVRGPSATELRGQQTCVVRCVSPLLQTCLRAPASPLANKLANLPSQETSNMQRQKLAMRLLPLICNCHVSDGSSRLLLQQLRKQPHTSSMKSYVSSLPAESTAVHPAREAWTVRA